MNQNFKFPILCIDYGIKNTGFSIAMDHVPLYIDEVCPGKLKNIIKVIEKYKPNSILFGLPVNLQDKIQYDRVKSIAGAIKNSTNLEVYFQDERFSSIMADDFMKCLGNTTLKSRNNSNDQVASLIILDIFLKKNLKDIDSRP